MKKAKYLKLVFNLLLFEKITLVIDIQNIFVFIYIKLLDMVNSIAITLLLLGSLVAYKRLKRKKRQFHAPPTNQLPS